jgi:hypothetical protein
VTKKEITHQSRGFAGLIGHLRLGAILFLLSFYSFGAVASPVQHPKRSINSYSIDLSPLFKWWTKHEGRRPLSAWVHITGSVVGTNGGAWILEAQVEGAAAKADSETDKSVPSSGRGPMRVFLQNPPVEDLAEFEQLSGRLNSLSAQRANFAGEESDAKTREQAVAEQQRANRRNVLQSRVLAAEDKQLKQVESAAKAQETTLDQQIKELKSKLAIYPNTDHYEVDCFALDLQYDYNRLPVYDHGRVLK